MRNLSAYIVAVTLTACGSRTDLAPCDRCSADGGAESGVQDAMSADASAPLRVTQLTAGGAATNCALLSNGVVNCWGNKLGYHSGDGIVLSPTAVPLREPATSLARPGRAGFLRRPSFWNNGMLGYQ